MRRQEFGVFAETWAGSGCCSKRRRWPPCGGRLCCSRRRAAFGQGASGASSREGELGRRAGGGGGSHGSGGASCAPPPPLNSSPFSSSCSRHTALGSFAMAWICVVSPAHRPMCRSRFSWLERSPRICLVGKTNVSWRKKPKTKKKRKETFTGIEPATSRFEVWRSFH